jgi:hypothetical protein
MGRGNCQNLESSRTDCGSCGNRCTGADPICNGGVCGASCAASGFTLCGTGPTAQCVDLQSNKQNCGLCSDICGSNLICANGQCVCPNGTVNCAGTCADLLTDGNDCGSCGTQCTAGQGCVGGTCQ